MKGLGFRGLGVEARKVSELMPKPVVSNFLAHVTVMGVGPVGCSQNYGAFLGIYYITATHF